jgi:sulfite reductase alpha subunit-like flavoprotein
MIKRIVFKEKLYALNEVVLEGTEEDIDNAIDSTYEGHSMDDYLMELGRKQGIKIVSSDQGEPECDDEVEIWEEEIIQV